MADIVLETSNSLGGMINGFYRRNIVEIEGGSIIPCDPRVQLVFDRILNPRKRLRGVSHPLGRESVTAWQYKAQRPSGISANSIVRTRGTLENASTPEEGRPKSFDRARVIPHSRLPLLLTVLYFRAKGHVVQRPLGVRGGTDDLVVWRSPVIDKLSRYGLIESGCLLDELSHVRELGRVENTVSDHPLSNDLAFVGIASSAKDAMKDDGAMNRLVGSSWLRSNPNTYKNGLRDLVVANRLYASFPMVFPQRQSGIENVEGLIVEFEQRQPDQEKVGLLIWESGGFLLKESSDFPHDLQIEHIRKYEMNMKRSLLANFQLHELFDFMEKLDVEFCRDGEDQILWEFEEKIKSMDVDIILSELIGLMDSEDDDQ